MSYTKTELIEIITILKEAQKRAIQSGGVTSYTINSGQGSTTVQQASLSSIRTEITYYTSLLNEITEVESGSHCISLHGMGYM